MAQRALQKSIILPYREFMLGDTAKQVLKLLFDTLCFDTKNDFKSLFEILKKTHKFYHTVVLSTEESD